jgi:hypothetical protein
VSQKTAAGITLNKKNFGMLYGNSERSGVLYGNHIYIVGSMIMKSISTTATLVVLAVLLGCSKAPSSIELTEGDIVDGVYRNERLGWQFPIPKDWKVLPKSEIERLEHIGHKAVEDATSIDLTSYHVPLLFLRKDQSNVFKAVFTAEAQAYDPKKDGNYRERQRATFDILLYTIRSWGFPIESQRSEETIGGLVFDVLQVTIYAKDKKTVVIRQCFYDRLINDRSLMVTISYKNERDKQIVLEALRQSKFSSNARIQQPTQPDK